MSKPGCRLRVLSLCFRSPEEAGDYVRTLQAMLRAVGASDGSMELVCISSTALVLCDRVLRDPSDVM